MSITVFYNADCRDCARKAARTAKMDRRGRIEFSTDESPIGPVPPGEIVVVDVEGSRLFTGVYATRMICLQVPVLVLIGLALYLPPVRRLAGGRKQGCNGDSCEI